MRIGIDVRCFARGKTTGVEGYTQKMLETLFRNDPHNEYVLFFNALRHKDIDWTWIDEFSHVSLKMFTIPNKLLNLSFWLLHYPKVDRLCGGVDLFFMPNINFIALSSHVPLILTVHDLSFEHHKETFSFKRRLWHYFVNPRKLVARAIHIIAVSEYTKEDICKTYYRKSDTVTVLLNGLTSIMGTLDRNSIELIQVKEKYELPYNFILYFGTIEPRKNISGLIRAYTMLRQADDTIVQHLVLAGSCGWGRDEIDREIIASPFCGDIHMITDIPEEDKEAFYALSAVFVYPSFFEGFGFPPLEAAMCKKPVITSHTSALSEVVGEQAVMIDPFRIEELMEAMRAVLTQKDLAERSAQTNETVFLRKFNWEHNVHDFLHIVHKLQD